MPQFKGRHAYGSSKPLKNENMTTDIKPGSDETTIRIDDSDNIDFWMEVTFTREELEKMLADMVNYKT